MTKPPKLNSDEVKKNLDEATKQFDEFDKNVKEMTMDRMNAAPKQEVEQQTKMSNREAQNAEDIYLKPTRSFRSKEPFNEKFRDDYNHAKEYVKFIAENREIIGEDITPWTKPFPGVPCEEWTVPVNKPVWGPRYLAEQIKRKYYHRLVMRENVITEKGSYGQMYGAMAADTTIQRLDAVPVSSRKSIFMGSNSF